MALPPPLRKWLARYRQDEEAAMHNRDFSGQKIRRRMPLESVAVIAAMRHPGMSSLQKETHLQLVLAGPPA